MIRDTMFETARLTVFFENSRLSANGSSNREAIRPNAGESAYKTPHGDNGDRQKSRARSARAETPRTTPWSVAIDARCTACGACLSTCPEQALRPAARRPKVLDPRCTGCGECVEICPRGAISDVWRQELWPQ
jgi:Fe-S-cluster-containing hydrogenase component 2